jgi:DNA-binding MurR/RpiR family transcriptional regulator
VFLFFFNYICFAFTEAHQSICQSFENLSNQQRQISADLANDATQFLEQCGDMTTKEEMDNAIGAQAQAADSLHFQLLKIDQEM